MSLQVSKSLVYDKQETLEYHSQHVDKMSQDSKVQFVDHV